MQIETSCHHQTENFHSKHYTLITSMPSLFCEQWNHIAISGIISSALCSVSVGLCLPPFICIMQALQVLSWNVRDKTSISLNGNLVCSCLNNQFKVNSFYDVIDDCLMKLIWNLQTYSIFWTSMVIWNHLYRRYQKLWTKIAHIYYGDLWKEYKNIDHCFEEIEWTSRLSFNTYIHKYVQGYITHTVTIQIFQEQRRGQRERYLNRKKWNIKIEIIGRYWTVMMDKYGLNSEERS